MKYYPENHAELLKIIQWYIGSEYANEDFEKLNSRLSFMRTSADKALNDYGEVEKDSGLNLFPFKTL